jgi:oligopeptide transport system substrate-binding protein
MLIVVTYREVEIDQARTLHRALLNLQRERLATRIKLTRLDREGTRALLATLFDEEITPEFLDSIYRETEGNPFFIEEICKALVESGKLTFENGRWHRPPTEELGIPQSIRVAVQTRASVLPERSRKILQQAAVLGRVFDLPTLKLATELDEDSLIEALEEALAAQLIEEEPGQEERFSFVHALIPASLVTGLRALRRRRLQRRAASALETLHPDDYEVLAHHFIEAGQNDKGAHYLLLAGDRARAQYAHEEAIDSYRGAIEYLKEEGQLEQAARALMKLGLAHNNAFDFVQSRHAYQEGFSLWQQTSLTQSAESAQPAPHALRMRIDEPISLDPGFAFDTGSGIFIEQFYCGLLQLTVEMDVVPDIALSWEVLEEGRRYRFYLRNDAFWSDGVPVSAADFVFAWERVLTPQNRTQTAPSLFMIKNGRDFHEGRLANFDAVGIKAVDALTLEIELENPEGTFLYLLCSSTSFAVPRHRLRGVGAPWMAWDELITNGPFLPGDRVPDQSMRLLSNPRYHGHRSGNIEAVEIIVPGSDLDKGRLALYEDDRLDVAYLGRARTVQARNRFASDHLLFPSFSTFYIGFNTRSAPFSDSRVRRGFALAVDKEYLSDNFSQGTSSPATGGFIPPGMPGHVAGIALPYNPDRARRLLAEAGYGEKSVFPPVNLLLGSRGTGHSRYKIVEYLAKRWHELLGIEIEIGQLPWSAYLERLRTDPPSIYFMAWTADFPDPDNFLRMANFRSQSGWRHEAYEHLIQQAREMMDQAVRMALYRQAEEILIEETPIIPLHYGRLELLIKPWVRRFPTSPLKFWYWKDVVIEEH